MKNLIVFFYDLFKFIELRIVDLDDLKEVCFELVVL